MQPGQWLLSLSAGVGQFVISLSFLTRPLDPYQSGIQETLLGRRDGEGREGRNNKTNLVLTEISNSCFTDQKRDNAIEREERDV